MYGLDRDCPRVGPCRRHGAWRRSVNCRAAFALLHSDLRHSLLTSRCATTAHRRPGRRGLVGALGGTYGVGGGHGGDGDGVAMATAVAVAMVVAAMVVVAAAAAARQRRYSLRLSGAGRQGHGASASGHCHARCPPWWVAAAPQRRGERSAAAFTDGRRLQSPFGRRRDAAAARQPREDGNTNERRLRSPFSRQRDAAAALRPREDGNSNG